MSDADANVDLEALVRSDAPRRSISEVLSTEAATLGGVLVTWLAFAQLFAAKQELWIDETTQLSGLRLSPIEVVKWLAGEDPQRFGVPGDRAPPLGYWLGWLWSHLFGLGENAMRAFGMVCVAIGTVFVVRAARRAFGPLAGWIAGLSLALSPNVIVMGVEIRSYPLYLAASAAIVASCVRILDTDSPTRRDFLALVAASVVAAYSHFFGLVAAGAAFAAILPRVARVPEQRRLWLASAGAAFLCTAGIVPFVVGAVNLGAGGSAEAPAPFQLGELVRATVRLAYRLLGGHPAVAVEQPIAALVLLGTTGLVALALVGTEGRARRTSRSLALGLVAGLVVVTLAKVAVRSFDSFSLSYNLWALPVVALLAGAGASVAGTRLRIAGRAFAGALIAGAAAAAMLLATHAECFAHFPIERLTAEIAAHGGQEAVLVVHTGDWGMAYYPLVFVSNGLARQYNAERGTDGSYSPRPAEHQPELASFAAAGVDRVLLVGTKILGAEEIRAAIHDPSSAHFLDRGAHDALVASGFRPEGTRTYLAQNAIEIEWFRR